MLGFGSYGSGGIGSSYPERRNAPVSSSIEFLPEEGVWQSDWEKRRAAEAAKARAAVAPKSQRFDNAAYLKANPDVADPMSWGGQFPADPVGSYHYGAHGAGENRQGANFNEAQYLRLNPDVAAAVEGGHFASGLDHFARHGWSEDRNVNQTRGQKGYTPDFSALNAERERMTSAFENQRRQQQAYEWMQGADQQNAIMSPDYANAGFNTITGLSNPYAGPDAVDGVGMDWASGVYDPSTQSGTGTYQPSWQRNNFGW